MIEATGFALKRDHPAQGVLKEDTAAMHDERRRPRARTWRQAGSGEEAPGPETPTAPGAAPGGSRPFVTPRLTRHEPLTRITLVSGNDFGGSGGSGGTFFGG
jgi:hypothetical protein